jgi:hypothetical protein
MGKGRGVKMACVMALLPKDLLRGQCLRREIIMSVVSHLNNVPVMHDNYRTSVSKQDPPEVKLRAGWLQYRLIPLDVLEKKINVNIASFKSRLLLGIGVPKST